MSVATIFQVQVAGSGTAGPALTKPGRVSGARGGMPGEQDGPLRPGHPC